MICVNHKLVRKNIEIPGIVQGDLCFILPLIFPNLSSNYPEASRLNDSKIVYESYSEFCTHCDGLTLQSLCEYQ